ncbi:nucleotidyltransferase-like protein [Caldalkalibacillus mannanilyticus]|uniref:nucleotidyltransferase-like protein n=1 Tax=Caldalkalibacillus mannanilyticus TaxID=1418 RepID=UPI00046AC1A4|nr:nucleotidyltransferase-like protein [Caldalkalibacillus mannanilyticus]
MDSQLRILYQERASDTNTLGIIHLQKKETFSPVTDGFDDIILVITENEEVYWNTHHYRYEDKKVQLITVDKTMLHEWLAAGSNRRAVEWVMHGKIVFDRNDFVTELKERLIEFPFELRSKRLCVEFGRLIRRYQEGKELLNSGDYLDSFNQILHALHHWARLSVIEQGFHPEVTLWKQVKKIDPEIYKLYDELLMGSDILAKRLELLLLASEFSVISKTRLGASHLLDVLGKKKEPWLFEEILAQQEVQEYSLDLSILLEHLVKKHLVDEVYTETVSGDIKVRAYIVSPNIPSI